MVGAFRFPPFPHSDFVNGSSLTHSSIFDQILHMKTLLSLALFTLTSNLLLAQSLHEQMIGRWAMETVMLGDDDVTSEHDPQDERWIEFHQDGKFFSDGEPYGANQGVWTVDEEASTFFLDSDVENDDSDWHVWFEDDKMYWRGIGDPKKERYVLSYTTIALAP